MILIVGLAIGIFFVLRYADRVKADPSKSVVYDMKEENEERFQSESEGGAIELTGTHKLILAVFALAFLVMMYGVIPLGGHGDRFAHLVVVVPGDDRVVPAVRDRDRPDRAHGRRGLTGTFVDGARDLLGVALIIGIARGITVIMNNGEITDTVLLVRPRSATSASRRSRS